MLHLQAGSVRDCKIFIKSMKKLMILKFMAMRGVSTNAISDKYPEEEIKFDIEKVRLLTVDIETRSENGFPDVETADQNM